jgi:hypothetical protein
VGLVLDRGKSVKALDELYLHARQYNRSEQYLDLMRFVGRFRFYAPFNAMLVHFQLPGATFVAPPSRWAREYGHRIKPDARPLVILQPRGPVMFVFDAGDTEPEDGAPPLPKAVTAPFEVQRGEVGRELELTCENACRDGVAVYFRQAGSQSAGLVRTSERRFLSLRPNRAGVEPRVEVRYELLINAKLSRAERYATLVHELAHLYCGHLGTRNPRLWPDRTGLPEATNEFEAESVCYLLCERLGIENPSDEYLATYVKNNEQTPSISLDAVMKAAGLIEQMGKSYLGPRKNSEND